MKLRNPEEPEANVDMTPMIDCVFLLLIFFMVSATMSKVDQTPEVVLPVAPKAAIPEDLRNRGVVNIVPLGTPVGDGVTTEDRPFLIYGQLTDEPTETLVAEVIREAALEGVRDELPHSLAVVVDEIVPREDRPDDRPLLDVRAHVYVERDSQKGIIIGRKGARLKEIGTTSRGQIQRILGTPVHLDLHVKVAKDWQRDPKQLRRLGF